MVYPVVDTEKTTTQKVYVDDVTYANNKIAGVVFADRVNKAFRFYDKYSKREELLLADVGVGLTLADEDFNRLVARVVEGVKHGRK